MRLSRSAGSTVKFSVQAVWADGTVAAEDVHKEKVKHLLRLGGEGSSEVPSASLSIVNCIRISSVRTDASEYNLRNKIPAGG